MLQYNQALFNNGTPNGIATIGVGNQVSNSCFRFNFRSMKLGCNSTDLPCQFNITGLRNTGSDAQDTPVYWNVFNVTACPAKANCSLTPVDGDPTAFSDLTSMTIQLTIGNGLNGTWWGDDLQLSWTNNGCEEANCRSKVPNTILKRRRGVGSLGRWMMHSL